MSAKSKVAAFYAGSHILVTGASGFIGRLLLEKLLRSCPELDTIYLIIRKKKGKNVTERLQNILEGPVFDLLRKEQPNFQDKLHPILGEMGFEKLGLDSRDREILINNVDVVFHCAATIRFTEPLRHAVNINVRGTRELLAMCERMPRLKCFMHVSTAFSFCPRGIIEEVHYDPPMHPETIIKFVNESDQDTIDRITPQLLRQGQMEWPNTYTFTKAIAEHLVNEQKDKLPVAIFRPSIVYPTFKEPVPMWLDSMLTPVGYSAGMGLGLIHVTWNQLQAQMNIVPGDYCINALLACGAEVGRKFVSNRDSRKLVFTYAAKLDNAVTFHEYSEITPQEFHKYPFAQAIYAIFVFQAHDAITYYSLMILFQLLPALIIDFIFLFKLQKPKFYKLAMSIHNFTLMLKPFCVKTWDMRSDNISELWRNLSETDKEKFPFDISDFKWEPYILKLPLTAKKYILKENMDEESIRLSKKKHYKLRRIHHIVKTVFSIFIIYLLYSLYCKIFC